MIPNARKSLVQRCQATARWVVVRVSGPNMACFREVDGGIILIEAL